MLNTDILNLPPIDDLFCCHCFHFLNIIAMFTDVKIKSLNQMFQYAQNIQHSNKGYVLQEISL